jgi:pimeloyl-ACP methyl ester carboxylesterase
LAVYAPSTGTPSAQALLQDALVIHDDLVARLAPDRIAVVGLSIGAGPAARLARSREVAGLILVTPFDTLEALAREHYPWLPIGLLLRHRMDVAGDLASVSAPVAVIAAEKDTIVPPRRTEPVRKAARHLVLDRTIANAGHNDIYDRDVFRDAMQKAMTVIETGEPR